MSLTTEAEAILLDMAQPTADADFRRLQALAGQAAGTPEEEAVGAYLSSAAMLMDAWGYDPGSYMDPPTPPTPAGGPPA